MRKCLLLFGVLLLVVSCKNFMSDRSHSHLQEWMQQDGKMKVLCSTAMVADIVQQVGGELIDCLTLIQGENDPHSYQLVKGDDEKFTRADLIFCSGLGLEHGPSLRAALEENPKVYSLGDYLHEQYPQSIIYVDKTVDPHVWMDVGLWQRTVPYICEALATKMPEHAAQLQENAKKVTMNLAALDAEVITFLHAIPLQQRYLVTTHDAFNYFTKAYLASQEEAASSLWRIRCQAPEGLSPDSQLSTADIQQLVDHLIRFKIRVIFAESNVSRDSLKKIVDVMSKKGQKVGIASKPLYADAMGAPESGACTYARMMRYDAETIAKELRDGS